MSIFATWYVPAGLIIGFFAALPIGPVNILIIQRFLARGLGSGLILGLAAALGDSIFASIAALGLSALSELLHSHERGLRIGGGLFMVAFGLLLWRQAPHLDNPKRDVSRNRHIALAIFFVTITNPATLLWFVAAVALFRFEAIGHTNMMALWHSMMLVLGVFVGAMLWWLGLGLAVRRLRARLADRHLLIMNHVAAAILCVFGSATLIVGRF